MRNTHYIAYSVIAAVAVCSAAAPKLSAASVRHYAPPPESYLKYSVYSVSQLIQELEDVPAVRARYARHFQIPENQVVGYMRNNLVESWVPQTRTYTVYCVNRSGKFFPMQQRFQKGTKVFALKNGQPVMKWICGNPLSRYLPTVETKNIVTPRQKVAPFIQELVPAEHEALVTPFETQPASFLPLVPLSAGSSSLPFISQIGSSGFSPLYLLPAAFLFNQGGSGGSTPPLPLAPPPVVPEASASLLALVALPGLLGMAVYRRKRALKR